MNIQAHVFIKGWVQGVAFRYWARNEASKLGLTGWVRNLEDGRVEAVFEGEKEKVEEMIEKCKEGPYLSRVEEVKVKWEKASGVFSDFEVRK